MDFRAGRRVLENGLTIITVPMQGWPLVASFMFYRAGTLHEPDSLSGIAHLMEHMMFRGTPSRPRGVIDTMTARLGGASNAVTTTDYAGYYFVMPASNWRFPLEIESDRMSNCELDGRQLELERQIALEERRMSLDDPESRLDELIDEAAFSAHPYRRPVVGSMDGIRAITLDDIVGFYSRCYTPSNAVLVVAGGIEEAGVIGECETLFGDIAPGMPVEEPAREAPPAALPKRLPLDFDRDTPRVVVAYHTPPADHPDSPALELMVTVLASGRSSRLFRGLVTGTRVATEISCVRLLQRHPSLLYASATLHPGGDSDAAGELMRDLIETVCRLGISEAELTKAKRLAHVDLELACETALGRAAVCGLWETISSLEAGREFAAGMAGLTSERLVEVARQHLVADRSITATLRPDTAPSRRLT